MKAALYLAIFVAGGLTYHLGTSAISTPYQNLAITKVTESSTLHKYATEMISSPVTQSAPALCGPASVEAIAKSFGVNIDQKDILSTNPSLDYWDVYFTGMTLDQLNILTTGLGLVSSVFRPKTLNELRQALSNLSDNSKRVIVNYSRIPMTGENIGHHTPVINYNSVTDSVILQDVTKGYGSYRVPIAVLFTAIMTADSETGKQRGLLLIEEGEIKS